jgi:hypothetical protein
MDNKGSRERRRSNRKKDVKREAIKDPE